MTEPTLKSHRRADADTTVVDVSGVRIGDGSYPVIAGPALASNADDLRHAARIAKQGGAAIVRAGVHTRSGSPYGSVGLGARGLEALASVRHEVGIPVMTEVVEPGHVEEVAEHVDMIQIGSDSMQDFSLLKAAGSVDKPVLLKRGASATIDEWLMAAEYILDAGNDRVVLCERGIRTFETRTRHTLDISSVPLVQRISHLPVIIDPGRAAGDPDVVVPLALAGRAAGADGLAVDVHPRPESDPDSRHQLDEIGYLGLMDALGVPRLRDEIDRIDREIVRLLARRLHRSVEIGRRKAEMGVDLYSPGRETELLAEVMEEARSAGMDPAHVASVFEMVLEYSKAEQIAAVTGDQTRSA